MDLSDSAGEHARASFILDRSSNTDCLPPEVLPWCQYAPQGPQGPPRMPSDNSSSARVGLGLAIGIPVSLIAIVVGLVGWAYKNKKRNVNGVLGPGSVPQPVRQVTRRMSLLDEEPAPPYTPSSETPLRNSHFSFMSTSDPTYDPGPPVEHAAEAHQMAQIPPTPLEYHFLPTPFDLSRYDESNGAETTNGSSAARANTFVEPDMRDVSNGGMTRLVSSSVTSVNAPTPPPYATTSDFEHEDYSSASLHRAEPLVSGPSHMVEHS